MGDFPPQLQHKLALVKAQKRSLNKISLWRSSLIIAFTISLGWAAALPYWNIEHPNQIGINGEKLVSEDTIRNTIDFDYPRSIGTVNGLDISRRIESIPSIAAARVNKQIIPPRLIISLQEKEPVAIATLKGEVGFLNAEGEWISQQFYTNITSKTSLPDLKVINYRSEYRNQWHQIYRLISLYPELKINEIQWQKSGGLFVQAKIGKVFLGWETSRLEQQFKTMVKLDNLPSHLKSSEIAEIDLSNPKDMLIQKY